MLSCFLLGYKRFEPINNLTIGCMISIVVIVYKQQFNQFHLLQYNFYEKQVRLWNTCVIYDIGILSGRCILVILNTPT